MSGLVQYISKQNWQQNLWRIFKYESKHDIWLYIFQNAEQKKPTINLLSDLQFQKIKNFLF